MDGGSQVAEVLARHGVRFVFTLCGGHISPILVAAKRKGIRVIDTRHEVTTVFAADAVSRLTGVPGVAAVTAGPGVTNTITAIKNAQLAQSPLVLLGGATATVLRGRGSLQDIDQMALIEPHVKWAARPNKVKEVVPALERAFEVAQSGVPGPVFVELAIDLLYEEDLVRSWYSAKSDRPAKNLQDRLLRWYLKRHLDKVFADKTAHPASAPRAVDAPAPLAGDVKRAVAMLDKAERPVLVLGSQTLLAPQKVDALVAAVEKLNIPVWLSGMARGLMGPGHRLHMRHKRTKALRESDLVILSGVPCDFRLDYGGHIPGRTPLISVNRSRGDLTRNRTPTLGALADPQAFVEALAAGAAARDRGAWMATVQGRDDARDAEIADMAAADAPPVNPLAVCKALDGQLDDGSILVADGGDFVATASYIVYPRGPLSWLDPGVFGTLGVGAGFALGAKLCRPEADVWLVWGDGSCGYSVAEYDTFVRHGLPIIGVVGNDMGWTQIARDQVPMLGDDVATVLARTDYHTVAEGWGGAGFVLDDPAKADEVMAAARAAARAGKPALVNAHIGRTDFRKGSISM